MEEFAYILDYLPTGMSGSGMGKKEPVVYAVGDDEFKLFILVPKPQAVFGVGDRVYIGKENATNKRDVIDHVKSRISYSELTNNALEIIISDLLALSIVSCAFASLATM